jgi:competence protein ComEA
MLDVDVSHSEMWSLRRYELAAWTLFVFLIGMVPLVARRNVSSAGAVSEVRVQTLNANGRRAPAQTAITESSWRLDVNAATESELELLPGIGSGRARAILKERQKRGAFHTIWELTEVPGVTKALVQRLEPLLRASPPPH